MSVDTKTHFESGGTPNAPFVASMAMVGPDVTLVTLKNNPAGAYPEPGHADLLLQCVTRGSGHACVDLGHGPRTGQWRRGATVLGPANTPSDYQIDFTFNLSIIGLPVSLLEGFEQDCRARINIDALSSDVMYDPDIERLMARMHVEAAINGPQRDLTVDYLSRALVALLAGKTLKRTVQPSTPHLADRHFELVHSAIEDGLDDKIGLTELAALCNMDVYRFSRAFKARTGTTPHQFLIDARLTRARGMLEGTNLSIADIAYACGFSSQAHMTTTFSKFVGISPGAYRREVRK